MPPVRPCGLEYCSGEVVDEQGANASSTLVADVDRMAWKRCCLSEWNIATATALGSAFHVLIAEPRSYESLPTTKWRVTASGRGRE